MHIFLDTNIYLSFYKLSDDDLEELKKLSVAAGSRTTTLYLTDQVRDEFRRNREKTVNDSLRLLEDAKLPRSFPRLFMNLSGYSALRESLDRYESERAGLLAEVRRAATEHSLRADQLIGEIFGVAQPIAFGTAIWEAARMRRELGNPPGKEQSYGDAVNWESLLGEVPNGQDLVLVTADMDYMSKLDGASLDEFLRNEWSTKKDSSISVHSSLTSLFKRYYPEIKLAAELEKELAIANLIASETFRSTHLAIQKLSGYSDFSADQSQALVAAANQNTQISTILGDDDVRDFFINLIGREAGMPGDEAALLRENLAAARATNGDEFIAPF